MIKWHPGPDYRIGTHHDWKPPPRTKPNGSKSAFVAVFPKIDRPTGGTELLRHLVEVEVGGRFDIG